MKHITQEELLPKWTWVHSPTCNKVNLLTPVVVKERIAFISGYQANRMNSLCSKELNCQMAFTEGLLKTSFGGSDGKEYSCNAEDLDSIPGLGGSSEEEENGNQLQYSGLENSIYRGAWQATVHSVTKSWTWLSEFHFAVHGLSSDWLVFK